MTNEKAASKTSTKETEKSSNQKTPPKEMGGRKGPDPVRYGDWENGGIASDF